MKHYAIALLAVFAPIQPMLIVTGVLVVLDFATGIYAAHKLGTPIVSSRMRDTITKMLVYQIAILTGFLMEKYLLADLLPISKIAAGVVAVVEGTSLFENLDKIYGKPIFKELIDKLGSKNKPE